MTLSSFKPYSKIIATIGIGAFALIVVLLFVIGPKNNPKQNTTDTTPSIPPISSVQLQQPPQFQTELNKIKNSLPVTTEKYKIEYRKYPNIINADIYAQSRDEFLKNKKEAEDYLKKLGLGDLCSLNIFWNPPTENWSVLKSIKGADTITTGCPASPKR